MRVFILLILLTSCAPLGIAYDDVRGRFLADVAASGGALSDMDAYAVLESMDRLAAEKAADVIAEEEASTGWLSAALAWFGVPEAVTTAAFGAVLTFRRPRALAKQLVQTALQIPGLIDRHPEPGLHGPPDTRPPEMPPMTPAA